MTREEFIQRYRDSLAGMILEGVTNKYTDAQLALYCRQIFYKVDSRLSQMYADFFPPVTKPPMPQPNGSMDKGKVHETHR